LDQGGEDRRIAWFAGTSTPPATHFKHRNATSVVQRIGGSLAPAYSYALHANFNFGRNATASLATQRASRQHFGAGAGIDGHGSATSDAVDSIGDRQALIAQGNQEGGWSRFLGLIAHDP
jgi:hypothetical protein